MEGYLWKKGTGSSALGRKNWKKRWFLLENQILSYYDDFNYITDELVAFKDSININGLYIEKVQHKEYQHTFHIKEIESDKVLLLLRAENSSVLELWIRVLSSASKDPILTFSNVLEFDRFYKQLGLVNNIQNRNINEVNKAYRSLCLKHHPDKGGSIDDFNSIQNAYKYITMKLEYEEDLVRYDYINYDVVLKKGVGGAGIGIVAVEDPISQTLSVKSINNNIHVVSLKNYGRNILNIEIGDRLMKLGSTDISMLPLIRLAQKLNDERFPPNSNVTLTLSRKVLKPTYQNSTILSDDDEEDTEVLIKSIKSVKFDESSIQKKPLICEILPSTSVIKRSSIIIEDVDISLKDTLMNNECDDEYEEDCGDGDDEYNYTDDYYNDENRSESIVINQDTDAINTTTTTSINNYNNNNINNNRSSSDESKNIFNSIYYTPLSQQDQDDLENKITTISSTVVNNSHFNNISDTINQYLINYGLITLDNDSNNNNDNSDDNNIIDNNTIIDKEEKSLDININDFKNKAKKDAIISLSIIDSDNYLINSWNDNNSNALEKLHELQLKIDQLRELHNPIVISTINPVVSLKRIPVHFSPIRKHVQSLTKIKSTPNNSPYNYSISGINYDSGIHYNNSLNNSINNEMDHHLMKTKSMNIPYNKNIPSYMQLTKSKSYQYTPPSSNNNTTKYQ